MRKIKTYLTLSKQTRSLMLESYYYLGKARLNKRVSFSKIAPTLGIQMDETDYETNEMHRKTLRMISQTIHIVSILYGKANAL